MFQALVGELSKNHPDTLLLPLSEDSPRDLGASPNVDWLTLPAARRATHLQLFQTYAQWFRPAVTVFLGGEELAPFVTHAGRGFGHRVVFSSDGKKRDSFAASVTVHPFPTDVANAASKLAPLLPITIVARDGLGMAFVQQAMKRNPSSNSLDVHLPRNFGPSELRLVEQVEQQFAGRVTAHVRMLQGVVRRPQAFLDLLRLRERHPKLTVRIVSERAAGGTLSEVLSFVLRRA